MAPHDGHGEPFAQAGEFIEGAGAGLAQEEDAVEQVVEVAQALLEFGLYGGIGVAFEQVQGALDVAVADVAGHGAVVAIALTGQASGFGQGVGNAAEGRTDHQGAVALGLALVRQHASASADAVGIGNGRTSEFQDLHGKSRLGITLRMGWLQVAVCP